MQTFLSNLKITTDQGYRPTTWIEIYILYRIRGFQRILDVPEGKAQKKPSADKQSKALKNIIRAIAIRTLDENVKKQFKPGEVKRDNLIGLAIKGTIPGISCNIYASIQERREIDKQVVKLGRVIGAKRLDKFIAQKDGLIARQFALNSKIQWDQLIPLNDQMSHQAGEDMWDRERDTTNFVNSVSLYQCPTMNCTKLKPSYLKCFQYKNLDNKVKCIFCKRQSIAYNWKCECGIKWHLCPMHGRGHEPTVLNTSKPKAKAKPKFEDSTTCMPANSGIKRVAPRTFEQNLKQEDRLKRICTGPPASVTGTTHCTGIPTKMGPLIAKRFGHLLQKEEKPTE